MGADGHIEIFDLEAIKKELTKEDLDIVKCAMVYEHEIFGRQVLTMYHGDNIYDYADDYSDMSYPGGPTKEQFEKIWNVIRKHRITSWEVWT